MNNHSVIGAKIRGLRETKNLSIEEIAERSGLGPIVTRAADREKDSSISFSNDATDARKHMEYHPLAQQKAGRHMEPFVIDINPEDSPEFQLSAHEGEEFIYVMQGEVEIVYGKETYKLGEGDSIIWQGDLQAGRGRLDILR